MSIYRYTYTYISVCLFFHYRQRYMLILHCVNQPNLPGLSILITMNFMGGFYGYYNMNTTVIKIYHNCMYESYLSKQLYLRAFASILQKIDYRMRLKYIKACSSAVLATRLFVQPFGWVNKNKNIKVLYGPRLKVNHWWLVDTPHKGPAMWKTSSWHDWRFPDAEFTIWFKFCIRSYIYIYIYISMKRFYMLPLKDFPLQ